MDVPFLLCGRLRGLARMHLSRAGCQAIDTERQTHMQAEDVKHQSEKAADKVGDAAGDFKDKVGSLPPLSICCCTCCCSPALLHPCLRICNYLTADLHHRRFLQLHVVSFMLRMLLDLWRQLALSNGRSFG